MAQLTIKQRQAGDVAILDLDGEVRIGDSATALRGAIRELVAAGNKKILLNHEKIKYLKYLLKNQKKKHQKTLFKYLMKYPKNQWT